eukprot:scaffold322579_cov42-Prasinocladus_malaysianus.AAC.1
MSAVVSPADVKTHDNIVAPSYASHDLKTGIVHFGVSNFARGHQVYTPALFVIIAAMKMHRCIRVVLVCPQICVVVGRAMHSYTRQARSMAYLEELLAKDFEHAKNWAYTGVGVRTSSTRHQRNLGSQGYRYSIVKSDGSGENQEVQIVGALRDVLVGPTAPGE